MAWCQGEQKQGERAGTGAGGGSGRPLGALGGGPSMPGGGAGGGGPPFPAGPPALPGALGGIIFWAARKGSCSE